MPRERMKQKVENPTAEDKVAQEAHVAEAAKTFKDKWAVSPMKSAMPWLLYGNKKPKGAGSAKAYFGFDSEQLALAILKAAGYGNGWGDVTKALGFDNPNEMKNSVATFEEV